MSKTTKVLIGVAVFVVSGFVWFMSLCVTGYASYKIGYKRGATAMIEDILRRLDADESPKESKRPKSDDETGNVGHFGS